MKDEEEDEQKKKAEEEKKKLDQQDNFPGEKLQKPELTPEQQEERLLLSGKLFEETEQLTEEEKRRRRRREKEIEENRIIELNDGRKVTLKQLLSLVTGKKEPYISLFSHETEFFSEVFRLNWVGKDPKSYSKPYIVSQYIKRIIYGRFQVEVFPALDHLNPIAAGGFRSYKLSQHLNIAGKKKLIQFRDEAVKMMKTFNDLEWYAFEKAYSKKYGLPFQRSLFDKED